MPGAEPFRRTDPPVRITDPAFKYTPSANTDLHKTFARVRERMAQQAHAPIQPITPSAHQGGEDDYAYI